LGNKMIAFEIALIVVMIIANGFLAMSEMALVSARAVRLRAMVRRGSKGAAAALALSEDSGKFLSTVQVGITLIGVVTGAFGGAIIAKHAANALVDSGMAPITAESLSLAFVVAAITYMSVVFGELVPKQIALSHAESIAAAVARPMRVIGLIFRPLVIVFDASSRIALRLTGRATGAGRKVSEEELASMIAEAESAGVVEPAERLMMGQIMRLGDRRLRGIMTPRRDAVVVNIEESIEDVLRAIKQTSHSHVLAAKGTADEIVGVIRIKDVLDQMIEGAPLDFESLVVQVPEISETATGLDVLKKLKDTGSKFATAVDDLGDFAGVVTRMDIFDAIARDFADESGPVSRESVQREDGSWLFDGAVPCEELADKIGIQFSKTRKYHTLAGFILAELKRLPKLGDKFRYDNWVFEVIDMDIRKIDKVLVRRHKG